MKRTVFTTTTTLPAAIARDTVIETLQNHPEMIELNPLVVNYTRCEPVPSAPAEERESHWVWYELTDRISFLPGGLLRGNVSYKGSFRSIPSGLRTHVYAPTGLDIRATWSVGGKPPGEKQEKPDSEPNRPDGHGLFLREEVDLRCPFWSAGFVKKTMRRSHEVLVDRLVWKAGHKHHLQDSSSVPGPEPEPEPKLEPTSLPPGTVPPPEIRINDIPACKLPEQPRAPPRRKKYAVAQVE